MSFSFPFPRSTVSEIDIYAYGHQCSSFSEYESQYLRKISSDTIKFKNQYLSIEEEMQKAFLYVQPTNRNLETTSVRFATIIRESSNLFEILARSTYSQLFNIPSGHSINITHFLTLDYFLDLKSVKLTSPMLQEEFQGTDILQPFSSLNSWDRSSNILPEHIPSWWTAYNKIKHDISGITDYATFKNALRSLGAAYLMINQIFGDGVVGGSLQKPVEIDNRQMELEYKLVPVSNLFIEDTIKFTISL